MIRQYFKLLKAAVESHYLGVRERWEILTRRGWVSKQQKPDNNNSTNKSP